MIEEADDADEIDMLEEGDLEEASAVLAKSTPGSTRIEREDDRPAVGSWWWINSKGDNDGYKPKDYDEPGKKWIACVVEVGSNYAKLRGRRFHIRLGLDEFHKRCKPESDPNTYLDKKVGFHKTEVRKLMSEIQRVCHQLGVPMNKALQAMESTSTALARAHGIDDVKSYKKSLVKLKDKTLPDLFAKVKEEHEAMAAWMKVELIPAQAELEAAKQVTKVIEDKIHTVELYAGLQEELVLVRDGDTASVDTKVHLMQRRHYMDEECLVKYEAGGMSFKDIKAFDKWLARDENMFRILPHERTIIAFRVRRWDRDTSEMNLQQFIRFYFGGERDADKWTFLYIRNGRQLYRMSTSVSFDSELFPNKEDSDLLGDTELWVKASEYDIEHGGGIITARQRNAKIDDYRACRKYLANVLWQWHRAGCPHNKTKWNYVAQDSKHEQYRWKPGEVHEVEGDPRKWPFGFAKDENEHAHRDPVGHYELLTPENIFYDDVSKRIARAAFEHNRIAVIVQGLLDRSTCLHPHPPWRIWTPEGFEQGIVLVYDVSKAITPGEAPDFEKYRAQLNKSIRQGCYTIGQQRAWERHMHETYGEKWRYHSQNRQGNGPGTIARVVRIKRNGDCVFRWMRERSRPKWVRNPERPGYMKAVYPEIPVQWVCPASELTCVNAYTPGDFHMFFDDPRTRANYVRWAPILLSAENWHHKRRESPPEEDDNEGYGDVHDDDD